MRIKQLFLTLALLCAMVQTSWAQASWDEVYAMTNTTSANWTALPEGTTAGATIGTTGATTYYYADANLSFTNSTPGGSALTILGTVYIYVPYSFTVTCTGANASGQTGAGAGIELTQGNALFLLGGGSVSATGGNAANGGDGTNGSDADWDNSNYWSGTGGTGGHGGGGAGAGIGTRGGQGGNGGTGAASVITAWKAADGGSGAAGQAGATAGGMGELYVAQSFGNLTATGGAAASQSGSAGGAGKSAFYDGTGYNYTVAGGGGGGAGGFGGAASNIGTGGPGGGGGGGGASGNLDWSTEPGYYVVKAPGGKGGQNADGTWAAAGAESIMNHNAIKSGQVKINASGWDDDSYNYDSYTSPQAVGTGGSGGALGAASTSESEITVNINPPTQEEWDVVCAQTNTNQRQWTLLPFGGSKGITIGAAGTTTYYFATGDGTFTNSNAGGSGLTILGTVHIFIASGQTITCTGANATAPTGGGAGIELAAGNTLYLIGSGKLVATGGNAANGGNGGAGGDADFSVDNWVQSGAGGKGGDGGGGAGAGIGTCGGGGGAGGTGGASDKVNLVIVSPTGNVGGNGASGSTAAEMGTLYIYQLPAPTAEFHGGSGGTASDNGGNGGRHALYLYESGYGTPNPKSTSWSIGGGGGGGGGGFGGAASDIGTGGPGGGGGGGGASGTINRRYSGFWNVGALGGSPGTNVDGTLAAAGESTLLDRDDKNLLARKYPEDENFANYGWSDGDNRVAGGSGGTAGAASTSGTYNVVPASISLADNADNSTTINTAYRFLANVTLSGRTLYKDGKWNTLCLPFALSAEQIAAHADFSGATLMELDKDGKNGFDPTDGTLYLTFKKATAIAAGVPYLVKWSEDGNDFTSPIFSGVTIDATAPTTVSDADGDLQEVQMVGCYSPVPVVADDKSILFLGDANTLYYSSIDRDIRSCRAYFSVPYIKGNAGAKARAFRLDFGDGEQTGITTTDFSDNTDKAGAWYDMSGRRLSSKPTKSGVYVNGGRKIVIK